MRILLLGGSKSGKSGLAQKICKALGGPLYYWATMEPVDGEDEARIQKHLEDRAGWGFLTVEAGRNLPKALPQVSPEGTVLFDSVTALLANEMFGEIIDPKADEQAFSELLTVSQGVRNFICVCDDIFRDGGQYDPCTEDYRKGMAKICCRLAAEFDVVCDVCAGIPHAYKGQTFLSQILEA